MESYTDFAEVYDEFMDETPYEAWCERIIRLINTYGVSKPYSKGTHNAEVETDSKEEPKDLSEEALALLSERNLVLDLGCGTGTLTEMLAELGYDMMGIDLSYDMIQVAMEKREESGNDIMYLCQDMRELELYCTVGTIICICDSINYLLKPDEIVETLKRVNNYLFPKGLFIFDFNTDYKYREVIGNTTIAENREDCSFIWDNFYDAKTGINEYDLTIFVKEEDDLFRRFNEVHYQRGYSLEEMENLVKKAGLELVCAMDSDNDGPVSDVTERVLMVCREKGKKYE